MQLAGLLTRVLLAPGEVSIAAQLCSGMVGILSTLESCLRAYFVGNGAFANRKALHEKCLSTAPAQLQESGLLRAIETRLLHVQRQRLQHKGHPGQQATGCCQLAQGTDCPGADFFRPQQS